MRTVIYLALLTCMLAVRCEGQMVSVSTNYIMEQFDSLEAQIERTQEFLDNVKQALTITNTVKRSARIVELCGRTNDAPPCVDTNDYTAPTWIPAVSNNYVGLSVNTVRQSSNRDNIIRELAKDGTICKAIGHRWEQVPHMTLEYRPDGNYPKHRKCSICGKEETFEVKGEWK